jgi:hypothetical protein
MYIVELRGILIKSWYITCTDFASLENMYARKKVIAQESYSNFEKKSSIFMFGVWTISFWNNSSTLRHWSSS